MSDIQQEILNAWKGRSKSKTTTSGWISGNCVACQHNGHNPDTRGRGGMKCEADNISFHCFNCGFTANWKSGRRINLKMRRLMEWMGMSDDEIRRISLFALSQVDTSYTVKHDIIKELPSFEARDVCPGISITDWLNSDYMTEEIYNHLKAAINYLDKRGLGDRLDLFHWSDEPFFNNRVFVPFTWQKKPVGYSGRLFVDGLKKLKYYSHYPANIVWGYDQQQSEGKFCIVVEGLFDAVAINGIAVCSNECNETQANIIESLNREVIVVPDRDSAGKKLIDDALKYNWNVAFPDWEKGVKDVSDAVAKYGNTFTMKSILNSVEHSNLKIKLMTKKWIN